MPDQTEIIPGLWMGGQTDTNLQTDFDAVVDLREQEDVMAYDPTHYLVNMFTDHQTVLLWCPMIDGLVLPEEWKIESCTSFLDKAINCLPTPQLSNKVLVHCTAGMNRSGLVIGEYLVCFEEMKPIDAIALIRQKRPGALSNQTFVDYLMSLKP